MPFQASTAQYHALNKLEALLIRRYLGVDTPGSIRLDASGGPRLHVAPELREEVTILKGLMRFYVYGHSTLVAQQYGQRQIVKTLFDILFESAQPGARHSKIIPAPFDESMKAINEADAGASNPTERVRLVMDDNRFNAHDRTTSRCLSSETYRNKPRFDLGQNRQVLSATSAMAFGARNLQAVARLYV